MIKLRILKKNEEKEERKEDAGGKVRDMRGKGGKGDWRGKLEVLAVVLDYNKEEKARIENEKFGIRNEGEARKKMEKRIKRKNEDDSDCVRR